MKIKKYVQSTFSVETNGKRILIDPGKYNFLEDKLQKDYFNEGIDLLLITHSHGDHFEPDTVKGIYDNSKPIIVAQYDVHKELKKRGISSNYMFPGDKRKIGDITLEAVYGNHKVDNIGFVIDDGKKRVYHPGDTLPFDGKKPLTDILLVPIGNRGNVMDPKEASIFTKEINPCLVIPMHYDGPKEYIKPEEFVREMKKYDTETKVLKFKEVLYL